MPRGKKPQPLTKTKVCTKCKTEKDTEEFLADTRSAIGKRKARCTACNREDGRIYYRNIPQKRRRERVELRWDYAKSKYGVTKEEYNRMLAIQSGSCAICSSDKPGPNRSRFVIDHCHDTGLIRGLLCPHCNFAIGWLKDNTHLMRMAIEYIEKSRRTNDPPTKEYYEGLKFFF